MTPAPGAPTIGIHVETRERRQFEEFGAGIEQQADALARSEALLGVLSVDGLCAPALADGGFLLAERGQQRQHACGVGLLPLCLRIKLGGERGVQDRVVQHGGLR